MGVNRRTTSVGRVAYFAEYGKSTKSFSVAKYGEAEALQLAQQAYSQFILASTRERAFAVEHKHKRYAIAPNVCFYWKISAHNGKAYPVVLANVTVGNNIGKYGQIKRALVKHGIKNAVVTLIKYLVASGYPSVSEQMLISNIRAVILETYTTYLFDLKTIPDFY